MRILLTSIIALFFLASCQNKNSGTGDASKTDVHEIKVVEAINTASYTYVHGTENGAEVWLAITKADIKTGGTYYYRGGLVMEKFESKDLKRTFDKIVFLEGLNDNKDAFSANAATNAHAKDTALTNHGNQVKSEKLVLNIKPATGAISISELFSKKDSYSGKSVKITGQITKYNADIMGKNWIHLQDGTETDGKYDLTVTTKITAKIGDVITLEGKITLNKDLGYGYKYEVLLEDADIAK